MVDNFIPVYVNIIDNVSGFTKFRIVPETLLDSKFTVKLNDVGKCVLTLEYNQSLEELLNTDDFIEIFAYINNNWQKIETYLYRGIRIRRDENNVEFMFITGVALNDLIKRRILDVNVDSLATNGFVTLGDTAHNVLTHLANEHFVASSNPLRNYPAISIVELNPNTVNVSIREKRENLLKIFQKVAEAGETDFRIVRTTTNNLELQLGNQGSDKTKQTNYPNNPYTVLSPNFGNLDEPQYIIDRTKELNYIYLLGEGEGDSQIVVEYINAEALDSPFNRIEFVKTFRNNSSDYTKNGELLTRAIDLLQNNRFMRKLDFNLRPEIIQNSLVLGDKLNVSYKSFFERLQIKEIEYPVSNIGIVNLKLKVETYVNS